MSLAGVAYFLLKIPAAFDKLRAEIEHSHAFSGEIMAMSVA
jgi:hypothetical protein